MKNLLSHPIPKSDESPFSLIHRTAKVSGYLTTSEFLANHMGRSTLIETVTGSNRAFSRLSKLVVGSLPVNFLYKKTRKKKSTYIFKNIHIDRRLLRVNRRTYCQSCVLENGYCSYLWDYSLISICPHHQTALTQVCRRCNTTLSWKKTTLTGCGCSKFGNPRAIETEELISQQALIRWLIEGNQQNVSTIEEIYFALQAISKLTKKSRLSDRSVLLSITAVSDLKLFVKEVAELLAPVSLPSRVILYPLLSSRIPEARLIGEQVLSALKIRTTSNTTSIPRMRLSLSEASSVLNVSPTQTRELIQKKLINACKSSQKGNWSVTLSSICKLIKNIGENVDSSLDTRLGIKSVLSHPVYRQPLTKIISDILQGKHAVSSFDVSMGLMGITFNSLNNEANSSEPYSEKYLTIEEAAIEFQHSKDHLRKIVKTGFLKSSKLAKGTTRQYIARQELIKFNGQYLIGPELANNASKSPTTFCLKLIAYGIKPLCGPSIDGAPIYLFRRSDILGLDFKQVERMTLTSLPQRPGRPQKGIKNISTEIVSFKDAEKALRIDSVSLRKLLAMRLLKKHPKYLHKPFVTSDSFKALYEKLYSPSYVRHDYVLKQLQMKSGPFKTKFIQTKQCTVENLHIAKVISHDDYLHIKQIHDDFLMSSEANKLFANKVNAVSNLEKSGLIKPAKVLKGWTNDIKLWCEKEVASCLNS